MSAESSLDLLERARAGDRTAFDGLLTGLPEGDVNIRVGRAYDSVRTDPRYSFCAAPAFRRRDRHANCRLPTADCYCDELVFDFRYFEYQAT